jgi:hypothetical protein
MRCLISGNRALGNTDHHAVCRPTEEGSRESVDAGCRNLTAPWVRDKAQSDPSVELCGYFEDLENAGPEVTSLAICSTCHCHTYRRQTCRAARNERGNQLAHTL